MTHSHDWMQDASHSPKWRARFMNLALLVSTWSKDPQAQVGAVVVSPDRRKTPYGFNGFPRGIKDDGRLLLPGKNELMVHAECNAIHNAKTDLEGWSLFVTKAPCHECAKQIIQAGIKEVIYYDMTDGRLSKWVSSQTMAWAMFDEVKIRCYAMTSVDLEYSE